MAIIKNRFAPGDENAWKELRDGLIASGKLGGSMVGVAAGSSTYKSATRLWAELKGLIDEPDISGKESVRDGRDLEDYVARRFEELSGKDVHRENCIFTNDAYPHLFATIDRKIANEESGLECKTANAMMQDRFTDDAFPATYYAQVCSYLAVTGMKRWYLCVWCMGVCVKTYLLTTVKEDLDNPPEWCVGVFFVSQDELAACETIAANFVASLASDHPAVLDGSDDETAVLRELHPGSNGMTRNLSDSIDLLLDERATLKGEIDEKERRIAVIENTLRDTLGDDEVGMTAHYKVTYKKNKPSSKTDWKGCCEAARVSAEIIKSHTVEKEGSRVLRITKAKK